MATPKPYLFQCNNGNDTPGENGFENMLSTLHSQEGHDHAILFCQETDLELTQQEFKASLGESPEMKGNESRFQLIASPVMTTKTKSDEDRVVSGKTGIVMCAVIDTTRVTAEFDTTRTNIARRDSSLMATTAYNKGGAAHLLKVTSNESRKSLTIRGASVHLDSKNSQKRERDLANVHQAMAFHAESWEQLVANTADINAFGGDFNTRNKYNSNGTSTSPWQQTNSKMLPEVESMLMVPFGQQIFSAPSTYNSTNQNSVEQEAKKRPGEVEGGALDFVGYSNNTKSPEIESNRLYVEKEHYYRQAPTVIAEPLDSPKRISVLKTIRKLGGVLGSIFSKSKRDHAIVGTPVSEVNPDVSEYDRVRFSLANQLMNAAPKLAKDLLSDKMSEQNEYNEERLRRVHNAFLSPDGLLIRAITDSTLRQKEGNDPTWFPSTSIDNLLGYEHVEEQNKLLFSDDRTTISSRDEVEEDMTQLQEILEEDELLFSDDRTTMLSLDEDASDYQVLSDDENLFPTREESSLTSEEELSLFRESSNDTCESFAERKMVTMGLLAAEVALTDGKPEEAMSALKTLRADLKNKNISLTSEELKSINLVESKVHSACEPKAQQDTELDATVATKHQ